MCGNVVLFCVYNSALGCFRIKFMCVVVLQQTCEARIDNVKGQSVPSAQDIAGFRQCLQKGASALFNAATGLPLQSSPVCTTSVFFVFVY